jgi:hypothetical protein
MQNDNDQRRADIIAEAQRRADRSGSPQRVYYAYSSYGIKPAASNFAGQSIAVVDPQPLHTIPAGRLAHWGAPDTTREIIPGVVWVTSPSHGGIVLSDERNAAMPDYMRRADAVYEEDCNWPLPIYAFDCAAQFAAVLKSGTTAEQIMTDAKRTMERWHPAALAQAVKDETSPSYYLVP